MTEALADKGSPRGLLRLLTKLPVVLFRLRLGFVFGQRLLMLEHRGRKSGKTRRTVLEVVERDESSGAYVLASGWGEKADWFQNLMASPDATITVGFRRLPIRASRLSPDEARARLEGYAARHPAAFRGLGRFMLGVHIDSVERRIDALVERVPLVALTPRTA
jgi:deazaflavin-dependent oxidoreductase (nitroreductase family)